MKKPWLQKFREALGAKPKPPPLPPPPQDRAGIPSRLYSDDLNPDEKAWPESASARITARPPEPGYSATGSDIYGTPGDTDGIYGHGPLEAPMQLPQQLRYPWEKPSPALRRGDIVWCPQRFGDLEFVYLDGHRAAATTKSLASRLCLEYATERPWDPFVYVRRATQDELNDAGIPEEGETP